MSSKRAEDRLEHLLLALEGDVLEARDEDIVAAAEDLGMKPEMKGSAALLGVTCLVYPRPKRKAVAKPSSAALARRRAKSEPPR